MEKYQAELEEGGIEVSVYESRDIPCCRCWFIALGYGIYRFLFIRKN